MSSEKVRDRFDELARGMIDLDVSSGDQGGLVFTEMGKEPVEVTSGSWTHMCEVAAKIETLLANAMRMADADPRAQIGIHHTEQAPDETIGEAVMRLRLDRDRYRSQVQSLRTALAWIGDPKRETEAKHSVILSGPFGPARAIREMQIRARAALIETADTLPPEKTDTSEKVPF